MFLLEDHADNTYALESMILLEQANASWCFSKQQFCFNDRINTEIESHFWNMDLGHMDINYTPFFN